MSDGIKKIADEVRQHKPTKRVGKSNRMLSLSEPQFKDFQEYCRAKGLTASEVVDRLIAEFMRETMDEPEAKEPKAS